MELLLSELELNCKNGIDPGSAIKYMHNNNEVMKIIIKFFPRRVTNPFNMYADCRVREMVNCDSEAT